jgi:hypothetical protein
MEQMLNASTEAATQNYLLPRNGRCYKAVLLVLIQRYRASNGLWAVIITPRTRGKKDTQERGNLVQGTSRQEARTSRGSAKGCRLDVGASSKRAERCRLNASWCKGRTRTRRRGAARCRGRAGEGQAGASCIQGQAAGVQAGCRGEQEWCK